jgi:hypothetical protein
MADVLVFFLSSLDGVRFFQRSTGAGSTVVGVR